MSLTPTLYKVYTSVLADRLNREVKENQTGFRKGFGTLDNIYVLNYLINRQISRVGRKTVVFFVDLRAAFDSVDRGILMREMRKRGVREGLVIRCQDVLRETTDRVKVGRRVGARFWTYKGVRQGCPLSPGAFNLLVAYMEEELRKGG